jgi:hypothetical protein
MVCTRSRRVLLTCAGLLVALAPLAGANVLPPTTFFVHVQPMDWSYCGPPGVNSCSSMTQTTTATGDMLFVVYMQTSWGWDRISSLDFTVSWDWGWWMLGWTPCGTAQMTYEYDYGNQVTLHFTWPDCPTIPSFMPVCAFELFATNDGCLQVSGGGSVRWGCPPGFSWVEAPQGGKAEAGVECDISCFRDCDPWHITCVPTLTPESVHFELGQGQRGHQLMHVTVPAGTALGSVGYQATEPWVVSIEATPQGYFDADLRVVVDATGLDPGDYAARLLATCEGRDCSEITLSVLDNSQSIPDDQPPPGGATPTTWGGVKNLFRR